MKSETYYFTFMQRQEGLKDKYVKIQGTRTETRQEMFRRYGEEWAFQYDEDDFLSHIELYNLTELR